MNTEMAPEIPVFEKTVFIIKPDGQKKAIAGRPLPLLIEGLIRSCGLDITEQTCKKINEQEVRQIYPILNLPSEFGEQWKLEVINAMQTLPIKAMIIEGVDAEHKSKIIKSYLRETLTDKTTERGRVVENIAHVCDRADFDVTVKVLFG